MSVRSMERFIAVQNNLHVIVSRRDIMQMPNGIPECLIINHNRGIWLHTVHIESKKHLRSG